MASRWFADSGPSTVAALGPYTSRFPLGPRTAGRMLGRRWPGAGFGIAGVPAVGFGWAERGEGLMCFGGRGIRPTRAPQRTEERPANRRTLEVGGKRIYTKLS